MRLHCSRYDVEPPTCPSLIWKVEESAVSAKEVISKKKEILLLQSPDYTAATHGCNKGIIELERKED